MANFEFKLPDIGEGIAEAEIVAWHVKLGDRVEEDQQLADMAQGAGVSDIGAVRDCIEGETYTAWAKAATDRAIKGLPGTKGQALTATPTVLVNGTEYVGNMDDAKEFAQFVRECFRGATWNYVGD